MNVFWALMTMTGRLGRIFLMRGKQIEGILVRHHHIGDHKIPPRPG